MDYEYNDDADDAEIYHFSQVIKSHAFTDEDIRNIFNQIIGDQDAIEKITEFDFEIRDSDIGDARITRYCKTESSHIFRIQIPNRFSFILKLNSEHSYDGYVAITESVRNEGIEVPINYFTDSQGIERNNRTYFALLQEYVEGVSFEKAFLDGMITSADKEFLLSEMGARLKAIHSLDKIKGLSETNPKTYFKETVERLDLEREEILQQEICSKEELEELYSKVESLVPTSQLFATASYGLTHFNFYPKNILIDASSVSPSIKAILDWTDSHMSNVYFDFALWDYWCGEDFLIDSLMESYGMESFSSSEAKLNVELTTIAALINEFCEYAIDPDLKAAQLGLWQRLKHEVQQATY